MITKPGLAAVLALGLFVSPLAAADNGGDDSAVSLALVGDIMPDETPGKQIEAAHDPFASFASLALNVLGCWLFGCLAVNPSSCPAFAFLLCRLRLLR